MVNRINAMLKYNPHGVPNPSDPFVIIMTDYFSTKFAKFYKQPDTMNCNSVACLNRYYHDFYIYNSLAYEYYKNNSFAPYHLTLVEVGEKVSITPFSTPSTTKPTTTTTTPETNNDSTASETTTTAGKPGKLEILSHSGTFYFPGALILRMSVVSVALTLTFLITPLQMTESAKKPS